MQSTDKTKPTHTDYLRLKKTTELNLRGVGIEWQVLDKTLQLAIEMEEKTRPKGYEDGEAELARTITDNSGDESHRRLVKMKCKKPTANTKDARA